VYSRLRHLRYRILLVLSGLVAVQLVICFAIGRMVILPNFESLEREKALTNLSRCRDAIEAEAQHLSLFGADWAAWDDTYRFVIDGNREYIHSNLDTATLEEVVQVNLVYIVDLEGRVKARQVQCHTLAEHTPLPEFPETAMDVGHRLLQHATPDSEIHGVVLTSVGPLLVASRPIVTSRGEGPIRGTIIMGRFLDERVLSRLQREIHVNFHLEDPRTMAPPAEQRQVAAATTAGNGLLKDAGPDHTQGWALLHDVYGQPALWVVAELPCQIVQRGRLALQYVLGSSTLAFAVLLGVIYWLMQRVVLRRVEALKCTAAAIEASGDLTIPVEVEGNDELAELGSVLDRMLRRLQVSECGLRDNRQALQSVFDAAPVGMLLFDPDRRICRANRAAAHLLGRTSAEMVGQTFGQARRCPSAEEQPDGCGRGSACPACPVRNALRGQEESCDFELHAVASGDETPPPVWIHAKAQPLMIGADRYVIMSLEDISAKKQSEAELFVAKASAEEASRLKSRFLSNMSHEIRTPLNGIIGFCDAILRCDTLETAKERARIVLRESNLLLMLINDLLDLSKVEAGKLTLERRPVELASLVNEVRQTIGPQALGKGLGFVTELRPDVPPQIMGDPLRLKQILLNLTSNAIKFTRKGEVRIRVACENAGASTRLRFSVRDTGIGIPEDRQQFLFEAFAQADASTTRMYGGTGLGLAIVRQLVSLMGGEIGLQSAPGEGSTFSFVLPIEVPSAREAAAAELEGAAALAAALSRPGHILVAEDYPTNQQIARLILEEAGHRVTIVPNGDEAVAICDHQVFDLILMDLQMPVMDGPEAAAWIRHGGTRNAGVPILGLTASVDAKTREMCLQAEMNDVLLKPIRRETLLTSVARWLGPAPPAADVAVAEPATAEPATAEPALAAAPEPSAPAPIDFEAAAREFGGPEIVTAVLTQFLANAEEQLATLRDALEQGERETLRRTAHALKGGAATLEAQPLADRAARLETASAAAALDELQSLVADTDAELGRLREYVRAAPD
jgi:signal transduction histidine kinase/sensor domain CHASE-containing protein/HPt (histidine-containing phosphotransfer) domain-containing protein/DNA-binding NarL/FixJ family response regulator